MEEGSPEMGVADGVPGVVPANLEKLLGFGRSFSFWPLLFGLACCSIEMMATAGPRYDLSRFGMEAMRASPRQADGMIVPGWCTVKMAPRGVRLYEQIPDPSCGLVPYPAASGIPTMWCRGLMPWARWACMSRGVLPVLRLAGTGWRC